MVILGGGIIGITSAYYLAKSGVQVTVLERNGEAGIETSFANGALITPSMADPWAAPGIPTKLLKWLGREDAPFLLRPKALPGLMGWGLRFLRNCNEQTWRHNTGIIYEHAKHSHDVLRDLTEAEDLEYQRTFAGTLRLFRDSLSMTSAKTSARVLATLGVPFKILDAQQCADLEPALAPQIGQISGGIHFPEDESGDAHLFTKLLAERCRALGVEFRFGVEVHDVETGGGAITSITTNQGPIEASQYLLALGPYSTQFARQAGVRLPVYPVKGYSITVSTQGWNAAPVVPIVDDGRKMGVVRLGDRLRVAGTAEFTGYDRHLNTRRIAQLVESVQELFPDCPNVETAQPWCGLRPMTPDGIPIIGSSSTLDNLWLNVGHGHLGWTLACGSGQLIAAAMTDNTPAIPLNDVSLRRF